MSLRNTVSLFGYPVCRKFSSVPRFSVFFVFFLGGALEMIQLRFSSSPFCYIMSRSGMGSEGHTLTLSIQHFLCRPWHCPPSRVPMKNGFREALVAHCMSEPCRFPFLDSCLKRFLWAYGVVDLALRPK